MKTRIITGTFGAIFVILLVLYSNIHLISAAVFLASLMGLSEFYKVVGVSKNVSLVILGFIGAVCVILGTIYLKGLFSALVCWWLLALFIWVIFFHGKIEITDLALTVFSIFYIPNLFSYVSLIFNLENGRIIIWFALIGAFITDTLAYFSGIFLGKHKLCPKISPKKTIEGAIGGTLGSGIVFLVCGYFFNKYLKTDFSLGIIFIYGILSAIVAQFGDLFASVLKRKYSVKDYGSIFPGHGGILDRCDSLLFVAPFIYFLFYVL